MSINLAVAMQPKPPVGQIVSPKPLALCTPIKGPVNTVPVVLDWNQYGTFAYNGVTAVAVQIDLNALVSSGSPLDGVRSVKIDNSYNNATVTVQFSDTLDTVICPPNSVVISPVATADQKLVVYADGLYADHIFQTTIFLSNAYQDALGTSGVVQSYKTQWKGASVNTTGPGTTLTRIIAPAASDLPQSSTRKRILMYAAHRSTAGSIIPQAPLWNGVAIANTHYVQPLVGPVTPDNPNGCFIGIAMVPYPTNVSGTLSVVATSAMDALAVGTWVVDTGYAYPNGFSDEASDLYNDFVTMSAPVASAPGALMFSGFLRSSGTIEDFDVRDATFIDSTPDTVTGMFDVAFTQATITKFGLDVAAPSCFGVNQAVTAILY